ncbi:MAG: hypothetical protein U9Q07_14845, partial [Planctomycetota bacterium]|nr:hypothetical protein [Planctomycetota bacterium]
KWAHLAHCCSNASKAFSKTLLISGDLLSSTHFFAKDTVERWYSSDKYSCKGIADSKSSG